MGDLLALAGGGALFAICTVYLRLCRWLLTTPAPDEGGGSR